MTLRASSVSSGSYRVSPAAAARSNSAVGNRQSTCSVYDSRCSMNSTITRRRSMSADGPYSAGSHSVRVSSERARQ